MTNIQRDRRPKQAKDLRERGRVILAHGEVTGHAHRVTEIGVNVPAAQFFEEPDGTRILLVDSPCQLVHDEHGTITLDPAVPTQVRQGDVFLEPVGIGAWKVTRQREYFPEKIRPVVD